MEPPSPDREFIITLKYSAKTDRMTMTIDGDKQLFMDLAKSMYSNPMFAPMFRTQFATSVPIEGVPLDEYLRKKAKEAQEQNEAEKKKKKE